MNGANGAIQAADRAVRAATRAVRPRVALEPIGFEALLERLDKVRRNGDRASAICSGHEDRDRSLSIGVGDDGRVLLHCFAGCDLPQILGPLGIAPAQLFPPRDSAIRYRPPPPVPATWPPRADRPKHPSTPFQEAEARALFDYLAKLRAPPDPATMKRELVLVGRILAGGTRAVAGLPTGFRPAVNVRTFPLRLLMQGCVMLAAEGHTRRWFSVEGIWQEAHRVGAMPDIRRELHFWGRHAVRMARSEYR